MACCVQGGAPGKPSVDEQRCPVALMLIMRTNGAEPWPTCVGAGLRGAWHWRFCGCPAAWRRRRTLPGCQCPCQLTPEHGRAMA